MTSGRPLLRSPPPWTTCWPCLHLPTGAGPARAGAAVETQLRRLPVFDHALIAEMDRRDVPPRWARGCRGAGDALRITPGEGPRPRRRDLGPRFGLPGTAAAAVRGHRRRPGRRSLRVAARRIITDTIDRLPHAMQARTPTGGSRPGRPRPRLDPGMCRVGPPYP